MDDLISRQAAIDALMVAIDDVGILDGDDIKMVFDNLPSAQPERKTGKWLEKEVINAEEAKEVITEWQSCKCSVCERYDTRPYLYYFSEPRFCSWCGADMREVTT